MPADNWRTMPARSSNLCDTTSASAGSSRSVGMKYCDQRIDQALWLSRALSATGLERKRLACNERAARNERASETLRSRHRQRTPNIALAASRSLMYHPYKSEEEINEDSNSQRSRRFCRERATEAFAD